MLSDPSPENIALIREALDESAAQSIRAWPDRAAGCATSFPR